MPCVPTVAVMTAGLPPAGAADEAAGTDAAALAAGCAVAALPQAAATPATTMIAAAMRVFERTGHLGCLRPRRHGQGDCPPPTSVTTSTPLVRFSQRPSGAGHVPGDDP